MLTPSTESPACILKASEITVPGVYAVRTPGGKWDGCSILKIDGFWYIRHVVERTLLGNLEYENDEFYGPIQLPE